MQQRLARFATLLTLAAALAIACSDAGGSTNGGETPDGNGTPVTDGTPGVPTFPSDGGEPTPHNFAEARDRLTSQLDAIGANIGAVPDDIREQLLERCRALKDFANDDDVEAICQTVEVAIDTNDPGLVDRVLQQLDQLAED